MHFGPAHKSEVLPTRDHARVDRFKHQYATAPDFIAEFQPGCVFCHAGALAIIDNDDLDLSGLRDGLEVLEELLKGLSVEWVEHIIVIRRFRNELGIGEVLPDKLDFLLR